MERRNKDVLYVYDRICTKTSKKNEIISEYGKSDSAKVHGFTDYSEKSFAKRQRERAKAYSEAHPYADAARNSASERRSASRAYQYEPRGQNAGGERVRAETRPLKLVMEKIVNMFDTLEERGRNDEWIAKRRAIARKKFYDHRNTILTALVMTAFAVFFAVVVYKVVFVVRDFEVTGSDRYSDAEVLEASGISEGDNLYSFSKSSAGDEITFRCPYIRSVDITRTIPKTVTITAEEDSEVFYANVWGDYLVLSPSLRVLRTIEAGQAREDGLVELVLPAVSYSVSGLSIEFVSTRDERFIRNILSEITSSELFGNGVLDKIDLTDEYSVTAQASGKYLLKLGGETDCDLKLKMAYRTIEKLADENASPAKIDLTTVGEAIVRFDMKLSLE